MQRPHKSKNQYLFKKYLSSVYYVLALDCVCRVYQCGPDKKKCKCYEKTTVSRGGVVLANRHGQSWFAQWGK